MNVLRRAEKGRREDGTIRAPHADWLLTEECARVQCVLMKYMKVLRSSAVGCLTLEGAGIRHACTEVFCQRPRSFNQKEDNDLMTTKY